MKKYVVYNNDYEWFQTEPKEFPSEQEAIEWFKEKYEDGNHIHELFQLVDTEGDTI